MAESDESAVTRLQKYLQIITVHPNPDYNEAAVFLENIFTKELLKFGADIEIITIVQGNPIVLISKFGEQPNLPSLLLLSHMDVVPVGRIESWKSGPFEAKLWPNGDIVARGSQDMKEVGMAQFEAFRSLIQANKLQQTVHLLFVPDEEVGGSKGMLKFSESEKFKSLNVGLVLDEGLPSETEKIKIFVAEKSPYFIKVKASGSAGHGSTMPQETAIGKILTFCSKVELFRAQQLAYASKDGFERTYSVNVTALEAGSQVNIIPEVASCLVDVRTPPHISIEKTKVLLKLFAKDANVEIEELYAGPDIEAESPHIENFKSKIYSAIENDLGISVEKDLIFLGSTEDLAYHALESLHFDTPCLYCMQTMKV